MWLATCILFYFQSVDESRDATVNESFDRDGTTITTAGDVRLYDDLFAEKDRMIAEKVFKRLFY